MNSSLLPFVWFLAILCLIPLALWLLKRTPLGGGAQAHGLMRVVAQLPISPSQRLLTVEVGQGEERRWLVLGVTGQQISTLHEMAPQTEAAAPSTTAPFAQLLGARLRGSGDRDAQ
ncbi:flagellar protein FliO/FliZ [Paucibacter oligotrophus]|uniref:Flagellar protein n=1 Tax=Roseateles oligotrophus TaxID=1769250 RepID=A0A840L9X4_9BURK|nr:flagellar biosynthetic protein FliO [Roseateles oligotrophus]MBB4843543.1 flagellar protein FliO/FliZ [Roseateles oligotrophus]